MTPFGISPDGKSIYATANDRPNRRVRFVAIDARSGRESTVGILNEVRMNVSAAMSPDGKTIAVAALTDDRSSSFVATMPVAGGEWKRIQSVSPAEELTRILGICWSRDGGSVFFVRAAGGQRELWRVPAAGGAATTTGIRTEQLRHPAENPRTGEIAFTGGREPGRELWELRNLGRGR
jgi:Tol biopolymer transport system component